MNDKTHIYNFFIYFDFPEILFEDPFNVKILFYTELPNNNLLKMEKCLPKRGTCSYSEKLSALFRHGINYRRRINIRRNRSMHLRKAIAPFSLFSLGEIFVDAYRA